MSDKLDVAKAGSVFDNWRSDMDNIVHRLRYARVQEPTMPSEGFLTNLGDQAAGRIEALEAEVAKLKNELESKSNPK